MDGLCIWIKSLDKLIGIVNEAHKVGLMKDISIESIERDYSKVEFPVQLPFDLSPIFNAYSKKNPIIKKAISKTIDEKAVDILNKGLNPG